MPEITLSIVMLYPVPPSGASVLFKSLLCQRKYVNAAGYRHVIAASRTKPADGGISSSSAVRFRA